MGFFSIYEWRQNAWYLGYHVQSSHLLCLHTSPVTENALLVAPVLLSSSAKELHTVRELRDSNTKSEAGLFKWTGKCTRSHRGEAFPAVSRSVMQAAVLLVFWGALTCSELP